MLAKIQGGSVDVKEPPGRIDDVISAATQRAAKQLSEYRVNIAVPSTAAETQLANPRIAAQAMYGLLENAAKYSPPGSAIDIAVSTDAAKATISVDDEGPGVPESDRELIFSRFYRRQHPSTAASPGLGMGLAIARGLVEAVGGSIAVGDKEGTGTRFQFSVPLFKSVAEQDAKHV